MRLRRHLLAVLLGLVLVLVLPGVANAQTRYVDWVSGFEVHATLTQGTFTGQATGDLPGYWGATVVHNELRPSAYVTGGSIYLATVVNGRPTLVTGTVSGGEVLRLNPHATGCVDEHFKVTLVLKDVAGHGTGDFTKGHLTHHRAGFFGRCILYSATITGKLILNF